MPRDLFKSNFRCPEHITILGPGPRGKAHWDEIPADSFVIAVNYAITIPVRIDAWCVADWWAIKTPWFKKGLSRPQIIRFFSQGLHRKSKAKCNYTFRFVPRFTPHKYLPVPEMFKPDGTVAAITMELGARFGAKRISLCGIDMSGAKYYDGNESKSETCPHGEIWAYVPYVNSLIEYYTRRGVTFRSVSETKLSCDPL